MGENTLPVIFGFHLDILLMLVSGIFYLLCAFYLWKPMREGKNELLGALFAFLIYQAINMFFMGVEMYTMDMFYGRIATLAVLIGSAYMLKFPFSTFPASTRKILFIISIIVAFGLFAWFIQTPEREKTLMNFTLWYDLVVNGIVVGGTMIAFALRTPERMFRWKALGGGSGVVSCCIAANATMLGGAILTSLFFAFLAPVLILGSLILTKQKTQLLG